jgi:hypothetical protein
MENGFVVVRLWNERTEIVMSGGTTVLRVPLWS